MDANVLADHLAEGKRQQDLLNDAASKDPSGTFPVNIDSMFLNQLSAERISSLCWTSYDAKNNRVSVRRCNHHPACPFSTPRAIRYRSKLC